MKVKKFCPRSGGELGGVSDKIRPDSWDHSWSAVAHEMWLLKAEFNKQETKPGGY